MKAKRPKFSALQSAKLPKYDIGMRRWEEALKEYLTEKGYM
jgi:dTDP-4-dehydrorhamnose reductase